MLFYKNCCNVLSLNFFWMVDCFMFFEYLVLIRNFYVNEVNIVRKYYCINIGKNSYFIFICR